MGLFTTIIRDDRYLIFKWSITSKVPKRNWEQCQTVSSWYLSFLEKYDKPRANLNQLEIMAWLRENLLNWDRRLLKFGIAKYIDGWGKDVLIIEKLKENKEYRDFFLANKPDQVEIKKSLKASNHFINILNQKEN